jgi:Rps23 Pro-64 3,4-dihydroxylase Tpa1-like proline 4-hydroxylase
MINLTSIEQQTLMTDPFEWAFVNNLFTKEDGESLADSYPRDSFKTVAGNDGEKSYEYESRSLIHMGATVPSSPKGLSPAWRQLADDLLSPAYRTAMTKLTGRDLTNAPLEVNIFHYTPGSWLGPHLDLKTKIVTHVLYFNKTWNVADGGCLTILRSGNISDAVTEVAPIVGNSSVIVRSEKSWHAVSRVVDTCHLSRRSVTVTFYQPDSPSTMWPAGENAPLHNYDWKEKPAEKRWFFGLLKGR